LRAEQGAVGEENEWARRRRNEADVEMPVPRKRRGAIAS
jgi:hypothetical protein